MANYHDEIGKMINKVIHKALLCEMEGFRLGTRGEAFSYLELKIMRKLREGDNKKILQLMEELQLNRGLVAALVKKLLAGGYITKEQSEEDRRVFTIKLTDSGKKILDRSSHGEKEFLDFILSDITVNEERAILKFLSKINQAAKLKSDRTTKK